MERREAWIALDLIEHIGPRTITKLLELFADPRTILKAGTRNLNDLSFLTTQQRAALSAGADTAELRKIVDQLDRMGAAWVCRDEDDYPALLKEIPDPPSILYVRGNIHEIDPSVAVVGTRSPSHYGGDVAFTLSRDLSLRGLSIVSGLARGIDTYAHRGALKGLGKTVAVLGSGIDTIYPPENLALAEEICARGAVVSEFPPGTGPRPEHFPRRNRIITGLSSGVVIVEATLRSGAMITARHALDQGRLCMAVPGAITNPRSKGPHELLRQGATLVEQADDVLMEIAPQLQGILNEQQPESERGIMSLVAGEPLGIEEIARALRTDITETTRMLSILELRGEIERVAGNRFTRRRLHG